MENKGKDYFQKIVKVAVSTKTALINKWMDDKCFIDNNTYTKKGLLPEGMGLTGLLLLAIAFREEEEIIHEEDRRVIGDIAGESVNQILDIVNKEGFSASPLVKKTELFSENEGYLEAVTWCLSVSILARYAERTGAVSISPETHDAVLELMLRSVRTLLESQRSDGTWGFRTDVNAARSLYFTYSASSSIADFFDYILGEIESVEEINDSDQSDIALNPVDTLVIEYLNKALGYDIQQKMNNARESLQNWLIRYALPLMPMVSSCQEMNDKNLENLGMWKHNSVTIGGQNRYFYHLYYTYYLIDMMVTSSVDYRFDDLIKDKVALKELKSHYDKNHLLSSSDMKYFFGSGDEVDFERCNVSRLYSMCVEQAIHSSRMQYIAASKTGAEFWASADSELPISWIHENAEVGDMAKIATSKIRGKLTDPCISPMSLRANTDYCYYVTRMQDMTVERLFEDICGEAYDGSDENEDCVLNLWDSVSYSLPITERSIEAVVDFYDYWRNVNEDKAPAAEVRGKSVPAAVVKNVAGTTVDAAIDAKISEYLQSEEGKKIILSAVAGHVPAAAASYAGGLGGIASELSRLAEYIGDTPLVTSTEDKTEDDVIVEEMLNLYRKLRALNIRTMIDDVSFEGGMLRDSYINRIKENEAEFSRRYTELFRCLVEDLSKSEYSYRSLYTYLKQGFEKNS